MKGKKPTAPTSQGAQSAGTSIPALSTISQVSLHITDKTQHSSAVLCVTVAPPAADVPNICHLYGIWRLKRKPAGPKLR